MIEALAFLAWLLGPIGIAIVIAIPTLITAAVVITRKESVRAQLCSDAMRDRREPVRKEAA